MKRKLPKNYAYSVLYEAVLEGGYVVSVPLLPGCHSQGETLEEAEKNIKEAIELYLESLTASNDPIPQEIKSLYGSVRVTAPSR